MGNLQVLIKNKDAWEDIKRLYVATISRDAKRPDHKKAAEECGLSFHTFRKIGKTSMWIPKESFEIILDTIKNDNNVYNDADFEYFTEAGKNHIRALKAVETEKIKLKDKYPEYKLSRIIKMRETMEMQSAIKSLSSKDAVEYLSEVADIKPYFLDALLGKASNRNGFEIYDLALDPEGEISERDIYYILCSSKKPYAPESFMNIFSEIGKNGNSDKSNKGKRNSYNFTLSKIRKILLDFCDKKAVDYERITLKNSSDQRLFENEHKVRLDTTDMGDNKISQFITYTYSCNGRTFENNIKQMYKDALLKLKSKRDAIGNEDYYTVSFGNENKDASFISFESAVKDGILSSGRYMNNQGLKGLIHVPLSKIYETGLIEDIKDEFGPAEAASYLTREDMTRFKEILDSAIYIMDTVDPFSIFKARQP